jgi:hypothetical protein
VIGTDPGGGDVIGDGQGGRPLSAPVEQIGTHPPSKLTTVNVRL